METAPGIDVAAAWHELGARLRTFVVRRIGPADADDVVQSVMVKLLERRRDIGSDSVRSWLFAVTRNAVVDYYRQRRPVVDIEEIADFAAADPDQGDQAIRDLSDCLEPMLETLPGQDGAILRRVDLEGEAQTAIAASLGIPLSTVKSRVQRARAKLRAAFDACCAIGTGAPACTPSCGPVSGEGVSARSSKC